MKKLIALIILLLNTNITHASVINNGIINKYIDYKKYSKIKNTYPTSTGTILVTPDLLKNILPIGHAAIIYNKHYLYEANAVGVQRGLNNWKTTKKRVFGLRVSSLSNKQHKQAASYAKKQVNKKYNFNFLNTSTRKKFYCSHLVWSSFYDNFKINLDTNLFGNAQKKGAIHPLELVLNSKTKVIYYHVKK